jgi:predicted deacylase
MNIGSRISTGIDFDRDGKQVGYLNLPHSSDISAHGNICIPIAVIRNGDGPTALFEGGNHGDEYEGQVGLLKLIRSLQPDQIRGRVIILPSANFPAVEAGTRNSPIDGGNLNRSFPGDPNGGPTDMIAHYVDALIGEADIFVDLHSGGRTLRFLPYVMTRLTPRTPQAANMAALHAFGAPVAVVAGPEREERYAWSSAERRGIPCLTGEFGGSGQLSIEGLRIVERGVHNVLVHMGILRANAIPAPPTRVLASRGRTFSPDNGMFEPHFDVGDTVEAGALGGLVHFFDDPLREPRPVHIVHSGTIISMHHSGLTRRGDALFWVAGAA